MNCLRCNFKNPATVVYCQKCGGKLDLTADDIRESLIQKAADERARNTEFYARQTLFFAIIVFLIAVTLVFLAGGAHSDTYAVPSAVSGTSYTEVTFSLGDRLVIPRGLVPYALKR